MCTRACSPSEYSLGLASVCVCVVCNYINSYKTRATLVVYSLPSSLSNNSMTLRCVCAQACKKVCNLRKLYVRECIKYNF